MVFLIQVVKLVPAMSLFPFYDNFKSVLPGPFSKYIGYLRKIISTDTSDLLILVRNSIVNTARKTLYIKKA